jgi:hypothetical protein
MSESHVAGRIRKEFVCFSEPIILVVVADPMPLDHISSENTQRPVAETDSSRIRISSSFHCLETQASMIGIVAEETIGLPGLGLNLLGKRGK